MREPVRGRVRARRAHRRSRLGGRRCSGRRGITAVAGGKVYLGSTVVSHGAGRAHRRDRLVCSDRRHSLPSPAVAGGRVFVASNNGRVRALDAATGAPLGPRRPISSLVVAGGGGAWCTWCSRDDTALRLRRATGDEIGRPGGGLGAVLPGGGGGVVFVGSNDQRLYAFDAITGAKLWATRTGGPCSPRRRWPRHRVRRVRRRQDYALSAATGRRLSRHRSVMGPHLAHHLQRKPCTWAPTTARERSCLRWRSIAGRTSMRHSIRLTIGDRVIILVTLRRRRRRAGGVSIVDSPISPPPSRWRLGTTVVWTNVGEHPHVTISNTRTPEPRRDDRSRWWDSDYIAPWGARSRGLLGAGTFRITGVPDMNGSCRPPAHPGDRPGVTYRFTGPRSAHRTRSALPDPRKIPARAILRRLEDKQLEARGEVPPDGPGTYEFRARWSGVRGPHRRLQLYPPWSRSPFRSSTRPSSLPPSRRRVGGSACRYLGAARRGATPGGRDGRHRVEGLSRSTAVTARDHAGRGPAVQWSAGGRCSASSARTDRGRHHHTMPPGSGGPSRAGRLLVRMRALDRVIRRVGSLVETPALFRPLGGAIFSPGRLYGIGPKTVDAIWTGRPGNPEW